MVALSTRVIRLDRHARRVRALVPSPGKQRIASVLPERTKWDLFMKVQAKRTQYLKPGDVVEARIRSADGTIDLGVQRNRIVAEV